MNKPVTFSVQCWSNADDVYNVVEDSKAPRHVSAHQGLWKDGTRGKDRAASRVEFSNKEHAKGRVAQAVCKGGHPCDFDRIHVPLREFKANIHAGALIFCEGHAADVAVA